MDWRGCAFYVALRKESVDRNAAAPFADDAHPVALRKESVDRNTTAAAAAALSLESLSARRAWIEMTWKKWRAKTMLVALRKESVDRNVWYLPLVYPERGVALRKESVDRNISALRT